MLLKLQFAVWHHVSPLRITWHQMNASTKSCANTIYSHNTYRISVLTLVVRGLAHSRFLVSRPRQIHIGNRCPPIATSYIPNSYMHDIAQHLHITTANRSQTYVHKGYDNRHSRHRSNICIWQLFFKSGVDLHADIPQSDRHATTRQNII